MNRKPIGGRVALSLLIAACWLIGGVLNLTGCGKQAVGPPAATSTTGGPTMKPKSESAPDAAASVAAKTYEASARQLLDARLPRERAASGWLRLFDGYTLYGWEIAGSANWSVDDQVISVDRGQTSLLCTSMPWQNFELTLDYRVDADTDSGIFLHSPLDPEGSGIDCLEVNLAGGDANYPTGSIVGRQKADAVAAATADSDWQSLAINAQDKQIRVSIDGQEVCHYSDPVGFPAGRIGLQHERGRAAFRNIQLRPLGLQNQLDRDLSLWTRYPDMPGSFSVTDDQWLHAKGGRNQLETKRSFGNFVLLTEFRMPRPEMNSGIFFRCIEGSEMMGYECQLSNQMSGDHPLIPSDYGTGGIFKRQQARLVAGLPDDWTTLVLVAYGPTMSAWVQGVQVSNWYDDRPENENPRRGSRTLPGTIMVQGHDPETDAYFRQLAIAELD